MYDLVIVGAGPAGSTLARLLGNEKKVLIIDKREMAVPFSGGLEKCCGGLLAPDAQEMLARFGLGLPKSVMMGPQLFAVRAMDLASGGERYYPRHYINVDREAFDRWLVSLLPQETECCWGARFLGYRQTGDSLRVSYRKRGKLFEAQTRLLVGADGARSRVRHLLGATTPPRYIALQEWFESSEPLPYFTSVFDPDITDFYAWLIPKEGALIVGAAIPAHLDFTAKFTLLKEKLRERGFALSNSLHRQGTALLRPLVGRGLYCGTEGIILIGEAAGWISPSSAEGISYAFKSALALARALAKGTEGSLGRYRRGTRSLALIIWGKTAKCPAIYWPFIRQLALSSGLLSINIIE